MDETAGTVLHASRIITTSVLVGVCVFLLIVLASTLRMLITSSANPFVSNSIPSTTQANRSVSNLQFRLSNDPHTLSADATLAGQKLRYSLHTAQVAIVQSGKLIGSAISRSAIAVGHGITSSLAFAGHAIGGIFVSHKSPKQSHAVSTPTTLSAPASHAPKPAVKIARQTNTPSAAPIWPIHGYITTYFGESELPYSAFHEGIDISDGKPAGVTPIHPYRPGKVIAVIHSDQGLGNHVIIDHGGGITSVYGHMYATAVQVGQQVSESTVIGYEGATGMATGPHVHFEIRVNGQPRNPQLFISGHP